MLGATCGGAPPLAHDLQRQPGRRTAILRLSRQLVQRQLEGHIEVPVILGLSLAGHQEQLRLGLPDGFNFSGVARAARQGGPTQVTSTVSVSVSEREKPK